jgi:hypothetical protein
VLKSLVFRLPGRKNLANAFHYLLCTQFYSSRTTSPEVQASWLASYDEREQPALNVQYSTQLTSRSLSFRSHFCASRGELGLSSLLGCLTAAVGGGDSGCFSPSESADRFRGRLGSRARSRETSCIPPHFSRARAMS